MSSLPRTVSIFINDNFTRPKSDNPTSGKPRIEFIDLAKGLCILLVVSFHCGYLTKVPGLSALRMPLYFILSGLFYKDYGTVLEFAIKKINRILIPFIFFSALSILIFLKNPVTGFLQPFTEPLTTPIPLWFLLCLFWANILYRLINAICTKYLVKIPLIVLSGVLGYSLSVHNIYLPLFLGSAFSALPFFYTGTLLRHLPLLYNTDKNAVYIFASIFMVAIAIAYCHKFGTPFIGFWEREYHGNIFSIYAVSLSMVIGLLLICKSIVWLPIISYLGRYSIIVFGMHPFGISHGYLIYYAFLQPTTFNIFVTTVLLSWIAIPICRRFAPKFTAQGDLIRHEQLTAVNEGDVA